MADIADIANDQTQYLLDAALLRLQSGPTGPSAEFCKDCDEPIPLLRQRAVEGCDTCVICQSLREQRR